jgi:pilus assembly protein FimV
MDQLKVSKSELAGGKPATTVKRSDEDLIAKEQALKEANERLAALERNVAELQRLVELKNQSLAELEKQSAGQARGGSTGCMPPFLLLPPAVNRWTSQQRHPLRPPRAGRPKSPPRPSRSPKKLELRAKQQRPAQSSRQNRQSAPKAEEPVLPPLEEPSFLEDLLTSTPFMAGGGGILALLAALLACQTSSPECGRETSGFAGQHAWSEERQSGRQLGIPQYRRTECRYLALDGADRFQPGGSRQYRH